MIKQVDNPQLFKQKALIWAASFNTACYLDSNGFTDLHAKFDTLIAAGVKYEITAHTGNAFEQLTRFRENYPGWMTGFFGYDLKNEIEHLSSQNFDGLNFPDLYFFVPENIVFIKDNTVEVIANDAEQLFDAIEQQVISPTKPSSIEIKTRFNKDDYLSAVDKIKEHITRGDIYVTNFCQEFYADDALIDPIDAFLHLNEISPTPFTSFFKWNNNYILCASPERFLAKRGNKLISQPIKGTAKRGKTPLEDEAIKQELRNHTKELQENVMVVDLVRNDLTRSAKQGTVKTEELFGIQSFAQVHQMVSTIVCQLADDISPIQAIKNTFPMGSMTGAPKISAMQLMESYERTKRGVYSGAIGYFGPDDDFDFNVVIRSLLYNAEKKYLSFQTGSAITYHADPEKEYEECLLKAKAIMQVLDNQQ